MGVLDTSNHVDNALASQLKADKTKTPVYNIKSNIEDNNNPILLQEPVDDGHSNYDINDEYTQFDNDNGSIDDANKLKEPNDDEEINRILNLTFNSDDVLEREMI